MKRICLYGRVSTPTQAIKQIPISSQISQMREWCAVNGYVVNDTHIFIEKGLTGTNDERPQFQEMIALATRKPPPFEYILVWDFSRFARNSDDSMLHKAILSKNGVRVLSLEDDIPDSPYGSLIERFIEIKDEVYVDTVSKATKRGLHARALQGYWLNTPNVPYGYSLKFDDNQIDPSKKYGRLVINEEQAKVVREIYQRCIRGYSVSKIADAISYADLNPRRIGKILANRNYTGTRVVYSRIKPKGAQSTTPTLVIPDAHPSIIDQLTFDRARMKLKSRALKNGPGNDGRHIFTGIIQCRCGRKMVHGGNKEFSGYYRCVSGRYGINKSCGARPVQESKIIDVLFDAWNNTLFNKQALANIVEATKERHKNSDVVQARDYLTAQLEKTKLRKQRLYDAIEKDTMPVEEVKDRIHKLNDSIVELEIKLSHTVDLSYELSLPTISKFVSTIRQQLLNNNADACIERQHAMRSIVQQIVVDGPHIKVKTNFMGMEDTETLELIEKPQIPELLTQPDIIGRRTLHGLPYNKNEIVALARQIRKYTGDNSINSRGLAKRKTHELLSYIKSYATFEKLRLAEGPGQEK